MAQAPPATLPAADTGEAGLPRTLRRVALAGVLVHAAFLPISIAGMQIGLVLALAALVALRLAGLRAWAHGPLDLPCLALVGAAVASLGLGALAGSPPVGWHEATLWRSLLAPLVVVSALQAAGDASAAPGQSRRAAVLALVVWACAALVPSALAWVQYRTGLDPLHALGLRRDAVRGVVPVYPGRFAAVGFFRWYQRLAHNLTPPLLVAAAVALHGGVGRRARAVLAVAAVAAAAAVVLTLSRAAWVALLAGGLVIAVTHPRWRRRAVPLAVAAAVAMALHPGVRARVRHLGVAGDNDDRKAIWKVCTAVIADHPLTGVGWGNLPRRSQPYYERLAPWNVLRAWCHDSFLSAWAEGGPLLFLALCAYWILLARAFWRGRGDDPLARAGRAGGLAAVTAMLLNALVHDVLYASESVYGLGFAVATALVLAGPRLSAPPGP